MGASTTEQTLDGISELVSVTPEKLVTIKVAAASFGLPYWKLLRAVKAGIIPSYTPFNTRRLVLLSEVNFYIQSTRSGGAQ
jgi:hypothetical protein